MSKQLLQDLCTRYGLDRPVYELCDTAEKLGGRSRSTVYRLIGEGKLNRVKIGARSLITRESIARYLQEIGA
jgi:excisionase family DNA binding protein